MTEGSSIRYTLTRGDLLAFQTRALSHSRPLIVLASFCFVAVVLLNVWHPPVEHRSAGLNIAGAIITALVLSVLVGAIAYVFLVITVWTSNYGSVLSEQTVRITEEGLWTTSEAGEGTLKWTGIHRIVSTKRLLIIFVNGTSARIIPKRCFTTPQAAEDFEREMKGNIAEG